MDENSSARIVAPLALIVAFIAVVVVVTSSGSGESRSGSSAPATAAKSRRHHARTRAPRPKPAATKRTYTVRSGDTFQTISQKTGVPVSTLRTQNPSVSPQALVVGQTIRLRP